MSRLSSGRGAGFTLSTALRGARSLALGGALIGSVGFIGCKHSEPSLGSGSVGAATSNAHAGEVLARIGNDTITVGEFQDRINQQSPYVRARYTSMERRREFLDNLVRFEVLAQEAQRKGLDEDEEVVRTMKQVMIQKLMHDAYERSVKLDDITDAECRAYYDAHPEEFNKPEEVRVADIVVPDEATAKKVLADARLKSPDTVTFRALVAEYSTDPATRLRGGDLRYFDANTKELPPEIVKAAFQLGEAGSVSAPVPGPGGLHVLKLMGRRKAITRGFDDVKAQIKNRLFRDKRQQAMEDYVKKLRDAAKVEVHDDLLGQVKIDTAQAAAAPNGTPPGAGQFIAAPPPAPTPSPAAAPNPGAQ